MEKSCETCKYAMALLRDTPCFECIKSINENHLYWEPRQNANPYWERICEISDKQRKKGLATYGQGLESNPADMLKRIEHLQEELIDGLMYCEWIKDKFLELEEGGSTNEN